MKKSLLLLLGLTLATTVHANLVQNGGFETGDFTDWTEFGDTGPNGYAKVIGNFELPFKTIAPHSGSYQAQFGPVQSIGGIEQSLAVTAGQTYQISYWLYNLGGTPSEINVKWGNDTIVDTVNPAAFTYTEFTQTVVAGGPTIEFGFQQVPAYFLLDDVSVVAIPEASTMVAGALLLVPFGCSAMRILRNKKQIA